MRVFNKNIDKVKDIGINEIKELLRTQDVIFVVDNIGIELKIIPKSDSYNFWKYDVKMRIVEPENAEKGFSLENYPDEYCYLASKWKNSYDCNDLTTYILLQVSH